ncbi:hypothetical protein GLOIN_2v1511678 [Rhizophagus clarus]|uniref:Uncharacterized protein n=1 Tax=Rhizophagus clarus TaxID=94130 RepID=A0A8H3QJ25_9GLOM|nr:hypothetical protein GLOIN_2v1511678 [Rhizophagus clarus]
MSNNDEETNPELNEDDILSNTQLIRMMDFGNEIKMIMDDFKNCEKIKVERSDIITEHIKEVKKLHKKFRKFVKESLNLNEQLEDYSDKILTFTKYFKDDNYPDDEILKLLKSYLKDSQRNYKLAKKLKNRLVNDDDENIGILSELTRIQNSTCEYIVDFENEVNSDESAVIKYDGEKPCEKFVRKKADQWLEYKKEVLRSPLNHKRNELDKLKIFDENLCSIIKGVGRIETFWDMQIRGIHDLIKKLKKLKSTGRGRINQRQAIDCIEKKWENVGKECQLYYITMKKLLHENKLHER